MDSVRQSCNSKGLRVVTSPQEQLLPIVHKLKGYEQTYKLIGQLKQNYIVAFVETECNLDNGQLPSVIVLYDYTIGHVSMFTNDIDMFDNVISTIKWDQGFLVPFKGHPDIDWETIGKHKSKLDLNDIRLENYTFPAVSLIQEPILRQYLVRDGFQVTNPGGEFDSYCLQFVDINEKLLELNSILDGTECLLNIDDAVLVDERWAYKNGEESLALMQFCCTQKISAGYRVKDQDGVSKLVSWIILYSDGSIGSLHSEDEYRGKGYARKVCSSIIKQLLEKEAIPFLFIKTTNIPSQKLMTSFGFAPTIVVKWLHAHHKHHQ
ncbi:hypothetical protein CYY_000033 [Polysphondylium violaceum]|uniref:N-acetyltransferase domain-containing protein n=1 Tax=Polysphondylium violaceum TaxID=133409 RepID=A0A8J4V9E2_9MYCE|nr:hypothetical protein CYY_000033 [Polysphondylium violaceum]